MDPAEPHNLTLESFQRVAEENAELRVRIAELEIALRKIVEVDRRPNIGTWGQTLEDGPCAAIARKALQ